MGKPILREYKLPTSPGIYIMKDASGVIVYVGKAKNIRKRVSSYFVKNSSHTGKIEQLVNIVDDIDYVITNNETEALVLENQYIKQYQPRYNTLLKDSKTYPYLKLNLKQKFPRLIKSRLKVDDGSKYFGPYVSVKYLNVLMQVIRENFSLRWCVKLKKRESPCLNYHLDLCLGPCIEEITEEEYLENVREVVLLLDGKYKRLQEIITCKMQVASEDLKFELAQRFKKQLEALLKLIDRQKVEELKGHKDYDIFQLLFYNQNYILHIFRIKSGYLVQSLNFDLESQDGSEASEIMKSAIEQFYYQREDLPNQIVSSEPIDDPDFLESFQSRNVKFVEADKWKNKAIIALIKQNAFFSIKSRLNLREGPDYTAALVLLQRDLELDSLPVNIIGIDISHLGGTNIVASIVYFHAGQPLKSKYRRYNIKTVPDNDDYASIREVVLRAFKRYEKAERPDLVLIDGGLGQLNAALDSLKELKIENQNILSLAKKEEIIYLPLRKDGVKFNSSHIGLKLLQQVRDEAHRFALKFQKSKRRKIFKKS